MPFHPFLAARSSDQCPLHSPFRLALQLPPLMPRIPPFIHLARPGLHAICTCHLRPPPPFARPQLRERERERGMFFEPRGRRDDERFLLERRRERLIEAAAPRQHLHQHHQHHQQRQVRFDLPLRGARKDAPKRDDRLPLPQRNAPAPAPRLPPHPRPRSPHPPPTPTLYILTYSLDRTPSSSAVKALLSSHLPARTPSIPLLHRIDASHFTPPPSHLCALYSGVSSVIQDHVMQDARARAAVKTGVGRVVEWLGKGRREDERRKKDGGRGRGHGNGNGHGNGSGNGNESARREAVLTVCCMLGTHRSVSIAEVIAREVKKEVRRGGHEVKVVVTHVHRRRGREDVF